MAFCLNKGKLSGRAWHNHLVVQFLSHFWLFANPQTVAHQASLSFTISWSLFKFMSSESVMLFNNLILECNHMSPLIWFQRSEMVRDGEVRAIWNTKGIWCEGDSSLLERAMQQGMLTASRRWGTAASRKWGPSFYNCKEWNLVKSLNEGGSWSFPRVSGREHPKQRLAAPGWIC